MNLNTNGYEFLKNEFAEIGMLNQVSMILSWDANVMLPNKSSEARGKQLAYLSKKAHQISTSKLLIEHLKSANKSNDNLNDWDKSNLELISRQVNLAKAIPEDLVTKITLASNKCEIIWREARGKSDFKMVAPYLSDLLELTKEAAKLKGNSLKVKPYDALLSEFDYGRTTEQLDPLFKELKSFLKEFGKEVIKKQKPMKLKTRHFPIDLQTALCKRYLKKFEFDFDVGRLDISTHPFCGGTPDDSRITTRYNESNITVGMYGVIHEAGHSLYERNLPREWRLQPVGKACGFAIHESQSLFFEKQIGMNVNFIKNLHKDLIETFACKDLTLEELKYQILNVESSYIRVEADEVTYPLHVILRYEIEKELFDGSLDINDLPQRWNSGMEEMLGIVPKNDKVGCLQDIHWYAGWYGYFPAYTVGAITAAQLMMKMRKDISGVDNLIEANNLEPIINWLNTNIHQNGSKYNPGELIKIATGESLNIEYFKQHLQTRYL